MPPMRSPSTVIMIGSIDGQRGVSGNSLYCATKTSMHNLTRALSTELGPHGIRVNCLGIGTIASSGFENYTDAGRETFKDSNPMKKVGDLWDVAETAVFVGGPTGKFMNGEIVHVDGADAGHFLQNLITANVETLGEGEARPCALLTPQGKVLADLIIFDDGDGGLLFDLPASANLDEIKSSIKNGLLTVRIGKTEEARTRKVEVVAEQ